MKAFVIHQLNKYLSKFNLQVRGRQQLSFEKKYLAFLEELLLNPVHNNSRDIVEANLLVEVIIFSKDRAMQLHALLESINYYFSEPVKIHVLYRTSSEKHENSYQEVKESFQNNNFHFNKESNFRNDLIHLVHSINVSKIFFLVDDIVFTETLNIRDFISIDTNKYVASLRLGEHLNFCYTLQKDQPLPPFIKESEIGEDKIYWYWKEGELDWHYPLSVDGHLFSTFEIKTMLSFMEFKAPNSLEEEMQIFAPLYLKRKGIAYKKAKILNIPCNKVQTENDNVSEDGDIEFFLKKWNEGYQIDFLKLQHFANTSAHQYVAFEYAKRKQPVR